MQSLNRYKRYTRFLSASSKLARSNSMALVIQVFMQTFSTQIRTRLNSST